MSERPQVIVQHNLTLGNNRALQEPRARGRCTKSTSVATWNRTCNPVQNLLVHIKSTNSEQLHGIPYLINKNPSGASAGMRFILTQTNTPQTQRAFRKTALTVISICSDSTCYTTMSCRRLEVSPE